MIEIPVITHIDDKVQERYHVCVDGKKLQVELLPREQWPEELQEKVIGDINLTLFSFPFDPTYKLEDHIHEMEGKTVDMGDLPSLAQYGKEPIDITLEEGKCYDIFCTAVLEENGGRILAGGGRFINGTDVNVPYSITLEEMKFLANEDLKYTPEEAKGIQAKITPLTAWGNSGRFIMAGFEFGKKDKYNVGLDVNHCCGTNHYHGYSAEFLREYAEKTRVEQVKPIRTKKRRVKKKTA